MCKIWKSSFEYIQNFAHDTINKVYFWKQNAFNDPKELTFPATGKIYLFGKMLFHEDYSIFTDCLTLYIEL